MKKPEINVRSAPFWIIVAAVIVVAVGVCAFFTYTLVLRTEYKNTALTINDAVLENLDSATVSFKDTELPASSKVLDYYNIFLLDSNTQVYSAKPAEETDERICIHLGEDLLSLQKLEDGNSIMVIWKAEGKTKNFRVRSLTSFMQLQAYFENYKHSLEKKEN